jgi:hypothetical protein
MRLRRRNTSFETLISRLKYDMLSMVFFACLTVTLCQATAAMLLSDCSARQQAAADEVEKAKVELRELQVRQDAVIACKSAAIAYFIDAGTYPQAPA